MSLLVLLPAIAWGEEVAANVELTAGNRGVALNAGVDVGLVPDRLFIVGSYGFLKETNISTEGADPSLTTAPSHFFGLGLEWTPSPNWMLLAKGVFSPVATDQNDIIVTGTRGATLLQSRQSIQALLGVMYQTASFETLDWSIDGVLSGAANDVHNIYNASVAHKSQEATLYLLRPSLGATLTVRSRLDLTVRGTYSWYSTDPTTVAEITFPLAMAYYAQKQTAQAAAILTAIGNVDALSGFDSAPSWVEGRAAVLYRFTPHLSGQLAYTFVRYVVGHGHAHVLSTRWSWKVHRLWRLWAGASLQYDDPVDDPTTRTSDPTQQPFWSGMGTLGGEFTYDSE